MDDEDGNFLHIYTQGCSVSTLSFAAGIRPESLHLVISFRAERRVFLTTLDFSRRI